MDVTLDARISLLLIRHRKADETTLNTLQSCQIKGQDRGVWAAHEVPV